MAAFDENMIQVKLRNFNGWIYKDTQISKDFQLKDFQSVLDFVNKVGAEAEKMDHHPDILMHSWNKVKISVSTHSEGGITGKDFSLAKKIEEIL